MWNAIVDGAMPRFWPPRPNRFWCTALEPWRRWYLRRYYGIAEVAVDASPALTSGISPGDGVLFAPNHSHDSDPHVMMEVGRRLGRQLHFMAAWQIFRTHWGLDGWVLQRMAETIEKLEEDLDGHSRPKGRRRARVVFGAPIDLSQAGGNGRPREVAARVTDQLETAIQGLICHSTERGD
ncbi:MAG TPA: hypothetical protein VF278_21340 [Pirellulales bacterium]